MCGRRGQVQLQEAGLQSARQAEAAARKHSEGASARVSDMQASIEQHKGSIRELEAEIGTSLVAQLSAEEQQDLATLNPRVQQLEACAYLRFFNGPDKLQIPSFNSACVAVHQDEGQPLKEALLEAQVAHTEAATKLSEDLLRRRERLEQELAAADLPALE
ncbi:hypothetical protein MMC29_002575 [Sticta canariensis]|nr:hypothetical protein [Sticta canariensis]